MGSEQKEVKIRTWLVPVIVSAVISLAGFYSIFNVARADVETLKSDVDRLKPLATAVAVINAEIPSIKNDVQEIKQMQKEIQNQQLNFQSDIQRDIKSLLQRR